MALVECVPNFSEGRDRAKIDAIVATAKSVPGVVILDVESDADHNRSVLSFMAPPDAAVEACFRLAKKCAEAIDLNVHKGEHPRMGAADVIPFIPVEGATLAECSRLAERLGERIGSELGIPVYLYDQAAKRPERRDLAAVRKGQFEGLREIIGKDPSHDPDYGPRRIHPTAGAVAVGARRHIVNFNVNLSTSDMELGKSIARAIRESSGGLPSVRAKEIFIAERGRVQVSTVLRDYKTTSLWRVFSEIEKLAREKGASVEETEIVGLTPRAALLDYAVESLKLARFNPQAQVLEDRLAASGVGPTGSGLRWQEAARALSDAFSSTAPTPGGGSAAAVSGQLGCSLVLMACGIAAKSAKVTADRKASLEKAAISFLSFRTRLASLADEDSRAFEAFAAARALPKDDPDRSRRMEDCLVKAAAVPLETAEIARKAAQEAAGLKELVLPSVASDLACGLHLLKAAVLCAAENVRINVASLKDPARAKTVEDRLAAVLK